MVDFLYESVIKGLYAILEWIVKIIFKIIAWIFVGLYKGVVLIFDAFFGKNEEQESKDNQKADSEKP